MVSPLQSIKNPFGGNYNTSYSVCNSLSAGPKQDSGLGTNPDSATYQLCEFT